MKEITKELHNKALSSFLPVIEQMVREGCEKGKIVQAYKNHIQNKVNYFYSKQHEPVGFKECFNVDDLRKADSAAEKIFYNLLFRSGVQFTFQHNIGPYRADYLVQGFLVVEIDGPQHDKKHDEKRDNYLRKMGYKVLRIPIWILVSCPESAIEAIKEAIRERR